MSISSNSDKAPRVSWTCEHCTYVNNPGVKVEMEERVQGSFIISGVLDVLQDE